MTTVINTPPNTTETTDNGAGWAVAVIILLAVIGIGVYLWMQNSAPAAPGTTNINVTVPSATTPPAATPATP
jgi:hypothetical protein